ESRFRQTLPRSARPLSRHVRRRDLRRPRVARAGHPEGRDRRRRREGDRDVGGLELRRARRSILHAQVRSPGRATRLRGAGGEGPEVPSPHPEDPGDLSGRQGDAEVPDGGFRVARVAFVVEQLLNALALAGLLFLVSAGLSLVFGILRVVNFAHGVFYMLGAYLGFTTVALTGWFWPALVVVPPVVGLLGALLESSTLRFIYRRPPIYQLLLTFGLALILAESVRVLYGPTAKGVEPPPLPQAAMDLGG